MFSVEFRSLAAVISVFRAGTAPNAVMDRDISPGQCHIRALAKSLCFPPSGSSSKVARSGQGRANRRGGRVNLRFHSIHLDSMA